MQLKIIREIDVDLYVCTSQCGNVGNLPHFKNFSWNQFTVQLFSKKVTLTKFLQKDRGGKFTNFHTVYMHVSFLVGIDFTQFLRRNLFREIKHNPSPSQCIQSFPYGSSDELHRKWFDEKNLSSEFATHFCLF